MCFDVENERIKKKFQECHMKDFLIKNTKNTIFWEFFQMLFFENTSNANLLDFFLDN